jgi:hypothetical protein
MTWRWLTGIVARFGQVAATIEVAGFRAPSVDRMLADTGPGDFEANPNIVIGVSKFAEE